MQLQMLSGCHHPESMISFREDGSVDTVAFDFPDDQESQSEEPEEEIVVDTKKKNKR